MQKLQQDKASLPIAAFRDTILRAVADHQVILVAGDTGCGKSTQARTKCCRLPQHSLDLTPLLASYSTQVPQYLLQAGFRRIACTQPRRISAMSLCRRVAYETFNEHGSEIAYQIRLRTTRTHATRVLFLTEGVLLRQLASDPQLTRYDVIIVDEVSGCKQQCSSALGVGWSQRCIVCGHTHTTGSRTPRDDRLFAGLAQGSPRAQANASFGAHECDH